MFYFSIYIYGNSNPNWLIFFRGVETTNLYIYILIYVYIHIYSIYIYVMVARIRKRSMEVYQCQCLQHVIDLVSFKLQCGPPSEVNVGL